MKGLTTLYEFYRCQFAKVSYASQALWFKMQFQYFSSPRVVPYENATSLLKCNDTYSVNLSFACLV